MKSHHCIKKYNNSFVFRIVCFYLFYFCFLRLRLESQFRQFTLGKHPGLTVNFRRIHRRDSSHCTKNDAMKEFRRAGLHTGTDQELHTLGGYELLVLAILRVIIGSTVFEMLKNSKYESGAVGARRRLLFTLKMQLFRTLASPSTV